MDIIKQKEEARQALVTQNRELLDNAKTENRELNEDEYSSWQERQSKIDAADKEIKVLKQQEENERKNVRHIEVPAVVTSQRNVTLADSFNAFIRGNVEDCHLRHISVSGNSIELRTTPAPDTLMGANTEGNEFRPDKLQPIDFVKQLKDYSGVRQHSQHLVTSSGATLPYPVVADTAEDAAIVAEGVERSLDVVVTANVDLATFCISGGIIKIPIELIEDASFDVWSWVVPALVDRIGRLSNSYFTTGTGSGQPQGVTNFTSGKTTASGTAVTFGELMDLEASLDAAYHPTAAWMMNQKTWGYIKQITAGDGLLLHAIQGAGPGVPPMLDGFPVVLNSAMPDIGLNNKPIVFYSRNAYVVRDVRSVKITRFAEKYMDQSCYAVMAQIRSGGVVVDTAGGRVLTCHSS